MTRFRHLRARGESGETLAEMMVYIVLFGVVGTVIVTAMIFGTRTSNHITSLQSDTDSLQTGTDAIAKDLRLADNDCTGSTVAFTLASATRATFCADTPLPCNSAATSTIDLQLTAAGTITETTTPLAFCAPATAVPAPTTRVIASGVTPAKNTNIFTFLDCSVAPTGAPAGVAPAAVAGSAFNAAGGSVSAANLGNIAAVNVNLYVRHNSGSNGEIPGQSGRTTVVLPNSYSTCTS